ncbi:class I SAM-dependent methyltransferase [Algihabitans albus]|uniref:class I SAM-dependent methyltransferase n=1 Tax=Algihabitans albus TaxID=2164067 RepID=UPI001ABD19F4|nr:methyltransferase domain-containing protein [Algihabitans albus]
MMETPRNPEESKTPEAGAVSDTVTDHYARSGSLAQRILDLAHGLAGGGPTVDDLAPLDQFHMRGEEATVEFAEMVAPQAGWFCVDLGCGIGGPARWLAAHCGVEVLGLDLTESYCRDAASLSRAIGLSDRVRFACADATGLPLAEDSLDLVWTQHAAMNVPDKKALYREVARVLKRGGRLALHDIMAGPEGPPHFPVPWAATPEGSFLLPSGEIRTLLAAAGLEELVWHDHTADALAWIHRRRADLEAGEPRPPGPHLFLGDGFKEMASNLGRNLEEGRITVHMALLEKTSVPYA